MFSTRILTATAATLVVGGAALFSGVAAAGGNVGWSVSIGGPGFAVSAGEPAYGGPVAVAPWRPVPSPYYRPAFHPRPVFYPPRFARVYVPAPVRYYVPAPRYYAPAPVVVAPRVVYAPQPWGY
ncbi:MAG: hypothetical protein U1F15_12935 [Burkholderiales bacterium]